MRSVFSVSLVARNPERSGRLKFGFLDQKDIEGVIREKVNELKFTGSHSVCVPLKDLELIRRGRVKRRG